ncbi:hypothetical protein [Phytohabitans suffuscus]|uniref:Uncharacterized protein n=1 Tax=Phytohabitans suffuscus TaxID=624315 RepID=A0A6F8YLY0_9ACTN|nr:hypothetical protein [Phytohabitans suffuscus]BCB86951.1 hypothetical protein Psuf_042640 [Phytohabitans suffuscus]
MRGRPRLPGTPSAFVWGVVGVDLRRAVELFVSQTGHWTAARWAQPAGTPGTRGDLTHGLVQRIADRAADAEGEPRRPVPRLVADTALTDQLRVVTADLLAAAPPDAVTTEAAADVEAVRAALS